MLGNWPQKFHDLVGASHEGSIVNVSFYDRPVANHWGTENVSPIGDAMHPYLPNLGQGACQAIEDAHAVVTGITRGHIGADLQRWMQKTRTKRARYFWRQSRQLGHVAQPTNMVMRTVQPLIYNAATKGLMRHTFRTQFLRPAYPTP